MERAFGGADMDHLAVNGWVRAGRSPAKHKAWSKSLGTVGYSFKVALWAAVTRVDPPRCRVIAHDPPFG